MSRGSVQLAPEFRSVFILKGLGGVVAVLAAAGLLACGALAGTDSAQGISKAAAESCRVKVDRLEAFAADANKPAREQPTRISQQEINSYLALDLSSNYSPSLKSLMFVFGNDGIQAEAIIDFDRLGMSATGMITKLMASMLSGTHTLNARGRVIAQNGKANFELQEARFDSTSLPNFLVEEIISTVGRRQRPPFDPMQPSQMPYQIKKVEIHSGYILVFQ